MAGGRLRKRALVAFVSGPVQGLPGRFPPLPVIRGETFTGDGALIVHAERTEEKEDKQCSELRRAGGLRSRRPPR
jgi:hypothetical protein